MRTDMFTILVIEDNHQDTELILRAFAKAELACSIQCVADGDAATKYLSGLSPYEDRQKFPMPTLVLLDLKLPRRSGIEVLQWIRSHVALSRLPVVILTSSFETDDINRAYDLGANSYLVKPVERKRLTEMLQALDLFWMRTSTLPKLDAG